MFHGLAVQTSDHKSTVGISSENKDRGSLEKKVDQLFAQWDKPDSPGCVLAIIRDGEIVYKRGYGMARLESQAPIAAWTVFDIGSMSKQFTAASILLLAESGKISLDDDIRKYLPEFPDYGDTITIRHLLYHTSGIRDYAWLMLLGCKSFEPADKDSKHKIVELVARQKHLYFKPGDDSYYSNSNYLLLGAIVERVTGTSLAEYEKTYIFEPLGMRHTFVREDPTKPIKHAASGYVQDVTGGYRAKNDPVPPGPGAVHSTVEGLFLWDQNFYDGKIGAPDFNAIMVTPGKLNNGDLTTFACGLEVDKHRGLRTVGHKGFTGSFDTYMVRFPEQKFSVICLANVEIHTDMLSMQIADLYLADQLEPQTVQQPTPESVQPSEVSIDPSILDAYVGAYRFDFGLLVNIKNEKNRLMMEADRQPTVELFPSSPTDFFIKVVHAEISFNKDGNGRVNGLTLSQMGHKMQARRLDRSAAMSPQQLSEFAGEYYNDELQVTYTVVPHGRELFVKAADAFESPMLQVQGDMFSTSRGDMVFQRNDHGSITSLRLDIRSERLNFNFTRKGAPK